MSEVRDRGPEPAAGQLSGGAVERSGSFPQGTGLAILGPIAERRVLSAVRRIVHAVDLDSRRLLQQCNLTGPQLVCLHTLAEEGPLTARALADRVHVNPSTLVGVLDRLEGKGLVERRRDRKDRRSVSLKMTERGEQFVRQAPSPLQATLMVRLREMNQEDQSRLASAMEEVVALMEAPEPAGKEEGT